MRMILVFSLFVGVGISSFFVTMWFLPKEPTTQQQSWNELIWGISANAKNVKTGRGVTSTAVEDGVRLSDDTPKTGAGLWQNSSYFILSKKIKEQVDGKSTIVELDISCENPQPGQQLGIAYYAFPQGGNSGWKKLPLTKGRSTYRLQYTVPLPSAKIKAKDWHYVMFRGSMEKSGAPIIVHRIKVLVDTLQQS